MTYHIMKYILFWPTAELMSTIIYNHYRSVNFDCYWNYKPFSRWPYSYNIMMYKKWSKHMIQIYTFSFRLILIILSTRIICIAKSSLKYIIWLLLPTLIFVRLTFFLYLNRQKGGILWSWYQILPNLYLMYRFISTYLYRLFKWDKCNRLFANLYDCLIYCIISVSSIKYIKLRCHITVTRLIDENVFIKLHFTNKINF